MRYKILGKVIRGEGYGRKLGFPTVNLDATEENVPSGVYAGEVEMEGTIYRAGIVVNNEGRVDAHLLGYSGDAYGKTATLEINKFLREYKKFKTEEELIKQIAEDLKAC